MRVLAYNLQRLINEIDEKDIKQLSNKFIIAIKEDFSLIQKVDYEFAEQLFVLDLSLSQKSNAFWSLILDNEEISNIPRGFQEFIKILKNKTIMSDSLNKNTIKGYEDPNLFKYLIARCLIVEGVEKENKAKIEEGEKMLESLMWQTENDPKNSYNYYQLVSARINALLYLLQFLAPSEVADCFKKIRKLKKDNTIIDPLFVYQTSLASLNNAKMEIKENVKEAKKEFRVAIENYHKTNMETLTLFVTIIAFILGVGGIVYKGESLLDKLIFLAILSFSVVTVFAAIISMIRFKLIVVGINILTCIVIVFCGYYFLMNNNVSPSHDLIVQKLINTMQTESEFNGSAQE